MNAKKQQRVALSSSVVNAKVKGILRVILTWFVIFAYGTVKVDYLPNTHFEN